MVSPFTSNRRWLKAGVNWAGTELGLSLCWQKCLCAWNIGWQISLSGSVMMLYRFDKKLRLLMFNEIEKIEIAIRRAVMQITADMTGNPFWLTYSSYFLDSSRFNETIRAAKQDCTTSRRRGIIESNMGKCQLLAMRKVHFS